MAKQKGYWSQTMIKTLSKYLGWDWRVLPLVGFLGSIVSAIFIPNIPMWGRLLFGYLALIIFFICYALAAHDTWKEDTDQLKKESKDLLDLQSKQKLALLQKNAAPQQYLGILVKRISLYKPQKDTPYAEIELNIS